MNYIVTCWAWIADHATVLSAVVGAISTFVIAGFTLSLVRATNEQGRLTNRTIDLARDEFRATHRPRLVVREVYWDPGNTAAVTFILGNEGSSAAKMIEWHIEFDRTDARPLVPKGKNVLKDWALQRGSSEAITVPIDEHGQFSLAAFQMSALDSVFFQGLFIYADEAGDMYRSVFKRVCRKGETVFSRTGNPDDEYAA